MTLGEELTRAGVDLERPRAADVETAWEVWRRLAAEPGRARWGFQGDRLYRVSLLAPGLSCTFAFEPAQGLRPVSDGEQPCPPTVKALRELPAFAAVSGRTPAALELG